MKRYFVCITGLIIMMMFSCQKENTSLLDVVEPELPVSTISDDALFAYKNREDSLKNRIIAALKYKNEQNGGIVQQSVAPYGQPLWDESESVTVDSAVRILVPMYDSLAGNITGLWCFDNRINSDSVYYGISNAPPALNDTVFAIDLNLVYDYFRFKLGLPTERNIRFEEKNNINTASVDIVQHMIISICKTMCAYVTIEYYGQAFTIELGCTTTCSFYSLPEYHSPAIIDIGGGEFISGGGGSGGSGNGNGNSQKKTYTITVGSSGGGIVTGGGTYPEGQLISITAQASDNYVFEHWTLNGSVVSTNRTYALTVSQNQTYVAKFIMEDCYNTRKIAENTILNGAANLLQGEAKNKTNEVARYHVRYSDGSSAPGANVGEANEVNFPLPLGSTYDWMFHSHPAGRGVIFSGGDLMTLYQIYTNHLYTDLSSFLFGVVNHKGSGYALSITDPFLFEQFAQTYRLGSNNPEYIKQEIDYQIDLYDISKAEEVFTEFISGSGLSLLKVNSIGLSQNTWDVITYNSRTKKVTIQPCD
jgi:hypothetical protein